MKKLIITLFIIFLAKPVFAYNVHLINNLPSDSTVENCNAITGFILYNQHNETYGDTDIIKSYGDKPLMPGKRRVLARNRTPEVLKLYYAYIYISSGPLNYETNCVRLSLSTDGTNRLLLSELISIVDEGNPEPAIDTRPIMIGNETFETVSVKIKVNWVRGADFNQSYQNDVARLIYIIKRKSTTTDTINITKGVLGNLRQYYLIS